MGEHPVLYSCGGLLHNLYDVLLICSAEFLGDVLCQ